MIKINLLPKELRPVDRTPFPRLILIFGTTAVGVGLLAYVAFLILVEVKAENIKLAERQKILGQYAQQVKQYDGLDADLKKLGAKTADIERVAVRDVAWWQVIDAVWSVVAAEDRKVWLEDIRVLDDKGTQQIVRKSDPLTRQFPPYGLQIRGYAAGLDAREVAKFRMDLKKHPVLKKFLPVMNFNPDYRLTEEKDFVEGVSMVFEVVLLAEMPKAGGKK